MAFDKGDVNKDSIENVNNTDGSYSSTSCDEDQPTNSRENQPANSRENQPANSGQDQPANSRENQPANPHEDQPANPHEDQPANPHEDQPANPHVKSNNAKKRQCASPSIGNSSSSKKPCHRSASGIPGGLSVDEGPLPEMPNHGVLQNPDDHNERNITDNQMVNELEGIIDRGEEDVGDDGNNAPMEVEWPRNPFVPPLPQEANADAAPNDFVAEQENVYDYEEDYGDPEPEIYNFFEQIDRADEDVGDDDGDNALMAAVGPRNPLVPPLPQEGNADAAPNDFMAELENDLADLENILAELENVHDYEEDYGGPEPEFYNLFRLRNP